jgi:crossover junction endodeoxyribonuclease RusA
MHISNEGRCYTSGVVALVGAMRVKRFKGNVKMEIDLYPPDRRRRDIDNTLKAILDSVGKAGVYADDSQVSHIDIQRLDVVKGGRAVVRISEVP